MERTHRPGTKTRGVSDDAGYRYVWGLGETYEMRLNKLDGECGLADA